MTTTTLLVDGEYLAHTIGAEAGSGKIEKAIPRIQESLENLKENLEGDDEVLAFPDESNFRKILLPGYRCRWESAPKPPCYGALVDHLKMNYDYYVKPSLSTSDLLGILTTSPDIIPGHKIVVSDDPALYTVAGWLYDIGKHAQGEAVFVNRIDADIAFYVRVLAGDGVENFDGCPDMDKEQARKLLARHKDDEINWQEHHDQWHKQIWRDVVDAFKKADRGEGQALIQARAARICRNSDYDFNREELKLWDPAGAS